MTRFKSIIFITVICSAVLLSGCLGEKVSTPVPTPTPVVTAAATPLETPLPVVIPTGNKTLVKLDSRRGFIPAKQTINTGDELIWENSDVETVTLVSKDRLLISNDGLYDNQTLPYGRRTSYVFQKPGTYTFYLDKTNLNGTVIVESLVAAPIPTPQIPAIKKLAPGTLYVSARMLKPAYWGSEKYELESLKVSIINQRNIPLSIKAQIISGEQILEENSLTLEREGSGTEFANDKRHFVNSTNVTLRLLVQGYETTEYNFTEASTLS